MSTKEVIRTSILSRKFRYMWTSVPNIDFEDKSSRKIENEAQRVVSGNNFFNTVDRVLALHDASVIKRFRLRLDNFPESFSRLNLWICIALEHNIEELELLLPWSPQYEMPSSLFNCNSLISLNISARITFKAPSSTYFSNLKKLLLSYIAFADELSTQRLFSNCSVLVELKFVKCEWANIKNVTISVPSLRNLTIIGDVSKLHRDGEYITDSHVKIVAANLACLEFSSHLDVDFEFIDMSSLKMASLDLPYNDVVEEEVATRALRLFSWVSDVEYLTLSAITIESLKVVNASLDHLPTFYSLTHLTVDDEFYGCCTPFLLKFLGKMPKLEYLELSEGCDEPIMDDEHITL